MAYKAGYTAVMSHRSGEDRETSTITPRSRGSAHQLRPDQNRYSLSLRLRPHREIQSACCGSRNSLGTGKAKYGWQGGAEGASLT